MTRHIQYYIEIVSIFPVSLYSTAKNQSIIGKEPASLVGLAKGGPHVGELLPAIPESQG